MRLRFKSSVVGGWPLRMGWGWDHAEFDVSSMDAGWVTGNDRLYEQVSWGYVGGRMGIRESDPN